MDELVHILSVLQAFDIEPGPLDRVVARYCRRHRELSSRERRLLSEVAFGVARWRRRLDGWLLMQGHARPDNRLRAACYLLWKRPDCAAAIPPREIASGYGIADSFADAMPRGFPGGAAAFHSFPDFLFDEMVKDHGLSDAADLAASLNRTAAPSLRANSLKASRAQAIEALEAEGIPCSPAPLSPWGILLPGRKGIEASVAYRRGLVEIQDESSQLAVIVANPKPGERVLDACAGAGGKTLAVAALMENRGRIVAADTDERKLGELIKRAKRAGASVVESSPAKKLEARGHGKESFDLVIVDAPCSGTGTLRRSPDLKWRLAPRDIGERVRLQEELIGSCWEWVRPGGRLAYMTCSVLSGENELVIKKFIQGRRAGLADIRQALSRFSLAADSIVSPEGFFKTDPRSGERDGFFAAVLMKGQVVGTAGGR